MSLQSLLAMGGSLTRCRIVHDTIFHLSSNHRHLSPLFVNRTRPTTTWALPRMHLELVFSCFADLQVYYMVLAYMIPSISTCDTPSSSACAFKFIVWNLIVAVFKCPNHSSKVESYVWPRSMSDVDISETWYYVKLLEAINETTCQRLKHLQSTWGKHKLWKHEPSPPDLKLSRPHLYRYSSKQIT